MVVRGGHVWLLWGVACVVAQGHAWLLGGHAWLLGGHAWLLGGHAWLLWGGMHGCSGGSMCGCSRGACVVAPGGGMRGCSGGVCGIRRDTEIRSMSGRYASYWNAFLLYTGLVSECFEHNHCTNYKSMRYVISAHASDVQHTYFRDIMTY